MIIFFSFNGNSPLGMLPLLLPLLAFAAMFFLSSHSTIMGPGVYYYYPYPTTTTTTTATTATTTSTSNEEEDGEEWSLESMVPVLTGGALLCLALYGFARQVQQQGLAATFQPLGELLGVFSGVGGRGPQRTRSTRGPRRARSLRSKEAIEQAVRALPIETYYTRRELEEMTIAELKAKATELRVDVTGVVEKGHLVEKLEQEGGTSASSCSICCEDYESGDPMRVLPCKHRFHVECADKWWLTATSYSRPPACPMCNTPLLEEDAKAGAT